MTLSPILGKIGSWDFEISEDFVGKTAFGKTS